MQRKWLVGLLVIIGGFLTLIEGLRSLSWLNPDSDAVRIDIGMNPNFIPGMNTFVQKKQFAHRSRSDESSPLGPKKSAKETNVPITCDAECLKEKVKAAQKKIAKTDAAKKDEKKKKKKKKVAKKKKEKKEDQGPVVASQPKPDPKQPNPSSGSFQTPPGSSAAFTPPTNGVPPKLTDAELIEKWTQTLLNNPTPENVNKFIDEYLGRKFSDEVFYTVVDSLLDSNRNQTISYGLLCLSATPSEASFSRLVHYQTSKSNVPWIASEVDRHLNAYTQRYKINLLNEILSKSNDSTVLLKATNLLVSSAEKNLNPNAQSTQQVSAQSMTLTQNAYNNSIKILTQLENQGDKQVQSAAQSAVDTLTRLLNS